MANAKISNDEDREMTFTESGKLVRAGGKKQFALNTIECMLNITDLCNFKCSYCCNRNWRAGRTLDRDVLEQFLCDIGERRASFYLLYILGGEPFLYRDIDRLLFSVDKYIPNPKQIVFVTNGSLLHKNISLLKKYTSIIDIKYLVSLHIEQIELDTYLENLDNIHQKNNIQCKLLLSPGQLDVAKKLHNRLKDIGIYMFAAPVFDRNLHAPEYDAAELDFLRSFSESADTLLFHEYEDIHGVRHMEEYKKIDKNFSPEKFSYKGMFCAAGMNTLRLGPDGVVVPCFGFMRHGVKFDLKQRRLRDIPELNAPCICPDGRCNCELFLQTPKWREAADAPAWLLREGAQA